MGFVDVPGHERFVKNMLAGVGGIDLVLLVIAADESIKPQTREHFEICRLLGTRQGLVALTKADLVDPEAGIVTGKTMRYSVSLTNTIDLARRLTERLGGARIYLKREDLLHTGAHKINNCLGQGLLAERMGKRRIIAETGAGQHGVATATVAATLAVKDTSRVIPMCHAIPVTGIEVEFTDGDTWIEATVRVRSFGRTGVEMEALTGVTVALLTIWDMVKSAEKDEKGQYPATRIEDIRVLEKRKG